MVKKSIAPTKAELARLNSRFNAATRRRKAFTNTLDNLTRRLSQLTQSAEELAVQIDKGRD